MGKRAYINDGNDNWVSLVSSLPNLDAYATKDYVDINLLNYATQEELDSIDLTPYLTLQSASSTYLTQSDASSTYLTQVNASTQYEKFVPYSASAPASAVTGDMWIDSSGTSPLLKTYNGSSWVSLGSTNDVIMRLNLQTVSSNYTIPSGYNGVTAGPITIADGVTVTVPDGSSWSIV